LDVNGLDTLRAERTLLAGYGLECLIINIVVPIKGEGKSVLIVQVQLFVYIS